MPIKSWTTQEEQNKAITPRGTTARVSDWTTTKPQPTLNKFGMDVSDHPTNPLNKNNQFIDPNTPAPKTKLTFGDIGKGFEQLIPGAVQTVKDIKANPLNIRNDFTTNLKQNTIDYASGKISGVQLLTKTIDAKKSLSDAWKVIKPSIVQEGDRIKQLFEVTKPGSNATASTRINANLQAVSGAANVAFSPLSALFNRANEVPILGTVSRLVTVPFGAFGEGGAALGNAIVDKLPISQQSKDQVKPGVKEIFALAGQMLLGKAGLDEKAWNGLKNKFGEQDATMIVTKAQELAQKQQLQDQTRQDTMNSYQEKTPFQKGSEPLPKLSPPLDPHNILSKFDKNILSDFNKQKKTLALQAPIEKSKPLELPPGQNAIYGEGFRMTDKPDKVKVAMTKARYEASQAFNEAVTRFNKNPIPSNLIRVQKARLGIEQVKNLEKVEPNLEKINSDSAKNIIENKDSIALTTSSTSSKVHPIPQAFHNTEELLPKDKSKIESTTMVEPKVSKASQDINTKIVNKGFEELSKEELSKYSPITKEDQIQKVSELLSTNPDSAKNMAIGKEPIHGDINSQVVFNAVKNKAIAENDVTTLRDLASSPIAKERSTAAQNLSAAGFDNGISEGDPVKAIQDVMKAREEKIGKSKNINETKKTITEQIKKEIRKTNTKETWSSFVESLKC